MKSVMVKPVTFLVFTLVGSGSVVVGWVADEEPPSRFDGTSKDELVSTSNSRSSKMSQLSSDC